MDRLAVMIPGEVHIPAFDRRVPGWVFLPCGPKASVSFLQWPGGRTPFTGLIVKGLRPKVR